MRSQDQLTVRLTNPLRTLFDSFLPDHLPELFPGNAVPATNIAETEDAYLLSFEMPGITQDEIDLQVRGRHLTVSAERKAEAQHDGKVWHRKEQHFGKWSRTLLLPEGANAEAVDAAYRNGILEVRVDKNPKSKPTRVQIRGA